MSPHNSLMTHISYDPLSLGHNSIFLNFPFIIPAANEHFCGFRLSSTSWLEKQFANAIRLIA